MHGAGRCRQSHTEFNMGIPDPYQIGSGNGSALRSIVSGANEVGAGAGLGSGRAPNKEDESLVIEEGEGAEH